MRQQNSPLRTRLRPPQTQGPHVERPRISALIKRGLEHRLTLLLAPAGWGKTSAVAHCLEQLQDQRGWLSIDNRDSDALDLMRYLLAAVPGVPEELKTELGAALLGRELDAETAAIILLNAVDSDGTRRLLVLDDAHHLATTSGMALLAFVIERAPANLHFILTTRTELPLPLSRLRARGELFEIHAGELRFLPDEAAALLSCCLGHPLPDSLTTRLTTLTEGWAVGLKLAALRLQSEPSSDQLGASFSGSDRFVIDYLMDEVLQHLPQDLRAALLDISILAELTPTRAAQVAQVADGHKLLTELASRSLFIERLAGSRNIQRLHGLFRELLLQQLVLCTSAEHRRALHGRAAACLETEGEMDSAIEHARQSESWSTLERLLLACSAHRLIRSDLTKPLALFARIPESVLAARPALAVRHYWLQSTFGASSLTLHHLHQRAQSALAAVPDARSAAELSLLQGIHAVDKDLATARALYNRAAAALTPQDGILFGLLHLNRAHLELADDCIAAAEVALQELHRTVSSLQDPFANLWAHWFTAQITLLRGDPTCAAAQLAELHRAFDKTQVGSPPRSAALAFVSYSHALGELGHMDQAFRFLDEAQALVDPRAAPVDAAEECLTRVFLEGLRAPESAAFFRALDRGTMLLRSYDVPLLGARLEAMRVRFLLDARSTRDRAPALREWLALPGIEAGTHALFCARVTPAMRRGFARCLRARVWTSLGYTSRAETELRTLIKEAEAAGRWVCAVEGSLALADLAERGSLLSLRDKSLTDALQLAVRNGIVSPFVGLSPALMLHLKTLGTTDVGYNSWLTHVNSVATPTCDESIPIQTPSGIGSPTVGLQSERSLFLAASVGDLHEQPSLRELEVLRMVARGLSNAEVARALYVAPSTVKKHLENVYGKLRVNRRTAAIAKARALGLLDSG